MEERVTHKLRIVSLLGDGMYHHFRELNAICYRYSSRLFELKEEGIDHFIRTWKKAKYYRLSSIDDLFNADECFIYAKKKKRGFLSRGILISHLAG